MAGGGEFSRTVGRILKRGLVWLTGSAQGNVTPIIAILLPAIVGGFAVASETSTWFLAQRSMQHAADSAALAAATNNTGPSTSPPPTYSEEARGVASRYGYTTGANNVSVVATYPTCPAPWTGNCYQVTITRDIPIRLARLVGYNGDVAMGAGRAKTVISTAIARAGSKGTYCLTTFNPAANALQFKGTPNLDLTGCDIASAGGASCNGNSGDTIGHAYVTTVGDLKNCGPNEIVGAAPADIYAPLAANIPADPCTHYLGTPLSGVITTQYSCGTAKLTGNVTVNTDVVLTIYNGDIDLDGFTLTSTGSGHLTIVFAGDPTGYSHIFKGNGTFDFAAPTTGPWAGVAIYQAPNLMSDVDISNIGNQPIYKVTGLLYMPNADIVIMGAIDHKTGGDNCMAIVAWTIDIRGTGGIFSAPTSQCDRANLTLQGPPGSGAGPSLIQ